MITPANMQFPTADAAKAAICAEVKVGQKEGIYISFRSHDDGEGITFRDIHIYGVRIPAEPEYLMAALSVAIRAIHDLTQGGQEDEEGK